MTQAAEPIWRSPSDEPARVVDADRLHPRGNRVLVLPSEPVKQIGAIHVPDSAQKKERKGTVIRVGPGKLLDSGDVKPIDLSAGDTVLFNHLAGKYAGTTVKLEDGREAIVIEEDDVIGVYR